MSSSMQTVKGECVLCCAVLCCAVLCCAVLCCAVLCCAVLCCTMLYLDCPVIPHPSYTPRYPFSLFSSAFLYTSTPYFSFIPHFSFLSSSSYPSLQHLCLLDLIPHFQSSSLLYFTHVLPCYYFLTRLLAL